MWNVTVASDFQVVGFNPENADLDHPRGEEIGEVFYLQATDENGNRRVFGSFTSAKEAETAFWSNGPVPEVEEWEEGRPEYGSPAYEDYGQADDVAMELREAQEEAWGF